jgi:hypothetical protein
MSNQTDLTNKPLPIGFVQTNAALIAIVLTKIILVAALVIPIATLTISIATKIILSTAFTIPIATKIIPVATPIATIPRIHVFFGALFVY